MGNNMLNVCKNTIAPTEPNESGGNNTNPPSERLDKPKRIKPRKSEISSALNSDIKSQQMRKSAESGQVIEQSVQKIQSMVQNNRGSNHNQLNENETNRRGNVVPAASPLKQNKAQLDSTQFQENIIVKSHSNNQIGISVATNNNVNNNNNNSGINKNLMLDAKSSQFFPDNSQHLILLNVKQEDIKNNNDMYFQKEDLDHYDVIYKNKIKNQSPSKNKNIRWQSGEVLGTGSFGQVILGMNIDTGELMAVKQVYITGYNESDRQEKVQQIQSEIEALQNFSHKHIVRYIGIKRSEKSINIFLEYVPGGSIASLLFRYGKFNETLMRKFISQILQGLEYLHAHEIIHRDIKGANVLVDKDGNCKLADFGSAKKIVEEKGNNDSIRGTPYWMAPEMIKQTKPGRFADIWSLGCTMIEMATAKPPWADRTPIQAMFYIANTTEPPPLPDFLSPECRHFISKCLKINPNERWNVRQLLAHPFLMVVPKHQTGIRQLAQITEEASIDYSTSSPDKARDYLTRGESRGNTLFHEESMKDSISEHQKAFTHKPTKASKHSNHSHYHSSNQTTISSQKLGTSEQERKSDQNDLVRAMTSTLNTQTPISSTSRSLHLQPKAIQSRSVQQPNHQQEPLSPPGKTDQIIIPCQTGSEKDDNSDENDDLKNKSSFQSPSQTNLDSIPIRKKHQAFKRSISQSMRKEDPKLIQENANPDKVQIQNTNLNPDKQLSHEKQVDDEIEQHANCEEYTQRPSNFKKDSKDDSLGNKQNNQLNIDVQNKQASQYISKQEMIDQTRVISNQKSENEKNPIENNSTEQEFISQQKSSQKVRNTGGSTLKKMESEEVSDSFSKEKFGKLRFSKPKSPKLVSQPSGTLANSSVFDVVYQNEKPLAVISEYNINYTNKDQIGSLQQESARDYAKYFGKDLSSLNENPSIPHEHLFSKTQTNLKKVPL